MGAQQGTVVAGGKGAGAAADQLDGPVGVCCTSKGDVVSSERGSQIKNFRVTRWRTGSEGVVVAGGNGCGDALDQLSLPWGVEETPEGGFVVVDSGNHRVMYWPRDASEGVVIAGGNGRGVGLQQLKSPCGVAL